MLVFRELSKDEEYKFYIKSFYESIGDISNNTKQITIEYLKDSYVVGVFEENNIMVAGYTLGLNEPFRLLEFVPENAKMTLPSMFKWDQCCEIVCVWKNRDHVSKLFTGRYFWPHIFNAFLLSGSKYLLGHNQSKKLDKYYRLFGPKSLYLGDSTYGLPSHLFIYGRTKIKFILGYSLSIHSIIQFIKKK